MAAVTSKMERFVIIVNGFQPLTIITKHSILDVAAALDPPLHTSSSVKRLDFRRRGCQFSFRSDRSSHLRCYIKKGVLKNLENSTRKHLCLSLFLINLQAFKSATLLRRNYNTGVFLGTSRNV